MPPSTPTPIVHHLNHTHSSKLPCTPCLHSSIVNKPQYWFISIWQQYNQSRALILGFIVFFVGLGISTGLFLSYQKVHQVYYRDELVRTCGSLGDAVSSKFNMHISTYIADFVGYLTLAPDLNNSTISDFSGLAQGHSALGINTISLMPVISRSKLASLESQFQFQYVGKTNPWSNYDMLIPVVHRHQFCEPKIQNPVPMFTNILEVHELAVGTLLSITTNQPVMVLPYLQSPSVLELADSIIRLVHYVQMPHITDFPIWIIELSMSSINALGASLTTNQNINIAVRLQDDHTLQQIYSQIPNDQTLYEMHHSAGVLLLGRKFTITCTGTQAMAISFKTVWMHVQLLVWLMIFTIAAFLSHRIMSRILTSYTLAQKIKRQKRLVSSLRTYSRAVVQAVNDPLLALDSKGFLVGSNKKAMAKLDLQGTMFSPLHITDMIGSGGQLCVPNADTQIHTTQSRGLLIPGSYEIGNIGPPAATFFAKLTASNISQHMSNDHICQVLVLHDITNQIAILNDLNIAQNQAKLSSKTKTQLLLFLSHELRNPIYVIDSNLDAADMMDTLISKQKNLRSTRLITDMITQVVELLSDNSSILKSKSLFEQRSSASIVDLVHKSYTLIQPHLSIARIDLTRRVIPECQLSGPEVGTIEMVLGKLGQVIYLGTYPGKSLELDVLIEPYRRELRLHCRGNIWVPAADNMLWNFPTHQEMQLPGHVDPLAHGVMFLSVMTLIKAITPLGGLISRSQFNVEYGGFDLTMPLLNTHIGHLDIETNGPNGLHLISNKCAHTFTSADLHLLPPMLVTHLSPPVIPLTPKPDASASFLSSHTSTSLLLPTCLPFSSSSGKGEYLLNFKPDCQLRPLSPILQCLSHLLPLSPEMPIIQRQNASLQSSIIHAATPSYSTKDHNFVPNDVLHAVCEGELANRYNCEDSLCEFENQTLQLPVEPYHLAPNASDTNKVAAFVNVLKSVDDDQHNTMPLNTPKHVQSLPNGLYSPPNGFVTQDNVETYNKEPTREQRILVVEDNHLVQRVTQRMVQKLGYIYECAMDGRECVDRVCNFKLPKIDLVLMDLYMPNMDGHEAMIALRAFGLGKDQLPIIAVTANTIPEERQKCIALGFNEFVGKPLKKSDLVQFCAQFF